MINLFTHYEDTKGNAKCINWGGFGRLGSHKIIGNITIRWSTYDVLFDFSRNYASILYHFPVTV